MAKQGIVLTSEEKKFLDLSPEKAEIKYLFVTVFDGCRWVVSTNGVQLHAIIVDDEIPYGRYLMGGEYFDGDLEWAWKISRMAEKSFENARHAVSEIEECQRLHKMADGTWAWAWRPLKTAHAGLRLRETQNAPILTLNPTFYRACCKGPCQEDLEPWVAEPKSSDTMWIEHPFISDPVLFSGTNCFTMLSPMFFIQ